MALQTNVRLKLFIDTETRSVLYGEADKDFVDFLFNLLSLPLGAVIRVLGKEHMVGCLGNLYHCVETLSQACFQPTQSKQTLLTPNVSFNCSTKLLPYLTDQTSAVKTAAVPPNTCETGSSFPFGAKPLFGASTITQPSPCLGTISYGPSYGLAFPSSSSAIANTSSCSQARSSGEKVGFVKGLATYIVMDDLTVKQISDFSIVSLFKQFNIKGVDALEERLITLNVDEGVELLKASLQSKMVLTDVFLRRERQTADNNIDNDNNNDSQLY